MNALTTRALAFLPVELQQKIKTHQHDERDDLIGQVAVELLEAQAGDSLDQIFKRARSAIRRFTQDPAHWSAGFGLDEIDPASVTAARTSRRGAERRETVLVLTAREGITERAAQMRVKKMIERLQTSGDLFSDNENDDGGDEE